MPDLHAEPIGDPDDREWLSGQSADFVDGLIKAADQMAASLGIRNQVALRSLIAVAKAYRHAPGVSAGLTMSNVLPVARPEGSGRPNKARKLISVWVSEAGLAELDAIATTAGVKRSDVIRLALKHGLKAAERDLKKQV